MSLPAWTSSYLFHIWYRTPFGCLSAMFSLHIH